MLLEKTINPLEQLRRWQDCFSNLFTVNTLEVMADSDFFLLVYNDKLQDLITGQSTEIEVPQEGTTNAENIAQAALNLCNPLSSQTLTVTLFLPSEEFFVSNYSLPGVVTKNIKQALQLQLADLLPGYEQDLLLSIGREISSEGERHSDTDGSESQSDSSTAFWMPRNRSVELHEAFQAVGLNLLYIMPRPLAAAAIVGKDSVSICDVDQNYQTCIVIDKGVIQHSCHMARLDEGNNAFLEQWQMARPDSAIMFDQLEHWRGIDEGKVLEYSPYGFTPPPVSQFYARQAAAKKKRWAIAAGVSAIVLLLMPLAFAWLQLIYQNHRLDNMLNDSGEVQQLRTGVVAFENKWSPVTDFPNPDIFQVLRAIDRALGDDSVLTAFSINEGVVLIEGLSPDPAELVTELDQLPEFNNVAQTRASTRSYRSGSAVRFGISMELASVDMAAYREEYISTEAES